jgi:transposase
MPGKDIIMVRQKELKRLHVIHKAIEGVITQRQAAEMISLGERQIRRIVKRIREEGDGGIQHQLRGRQCNRKLAKKLADRIVELYRQKYKGFGPTLTSEKLSEYDGISVSKETVRAYLIGSGEWKKDRKIRTHRRWRPRKERCGEMLQMDGSKHKWFEDRGPECVLMAYIDDATGRVYGRFYEYEGTIPAMDSFKRYIKKYGVPMSVYFDRHTTYKSPAEPTIEEEINGTEPLSEFGRALTELDVKLIHAYSPQAKGRIERQFKTLQDRLVKELRLCGISTIEEANKFLGETYWANYNRKFMVKALHEDDMHRTVPKGINLDEILCIRTDRQVRNDNTIAHNKKLYQLKESFPKKSKVRVEERVNGSMLIIYHERRIKYSQILARPEKLHAEKKKRSRRNATPIASGNHQVRQSMEYLFNRQELRKRLRKAAA